MRTRLLSLLVIPVLVLAGCGGDDGADSSGASDAPATEADADATEAMTEAASEATSEAGTEASTEAAEGGSETAAPVTRAEGDLVIWADDTRVAALQPFADQFGEEQGITVVLQELAFDEITNQFQTAAPAGEGPDIIVTAHDGIGQLVTNGVISPIELPNQDEFVGVAVEAFTYDGQLYGLPYATENIALVRNTDMVPDVPADFAELEETALGLVESGDAEVALALQADPADPYHNYPLFTAFGASVFAQNDDGTYNPDELGIDSPEGLAAADAFAGWVESGLINPNLTYDTMVSSFSEGKAPFAITGPWAVSQEDPPGFRAQGVNYEVTPIPEVEGGTPAPFVGVQGFMVSSFSENALLAQTFLTDFMATEDVQLALFEAGGRPPALQSALDQVSDDPDVQGFAASGADGQPLPAIPEMSSVWSAWTDAYSLIWQGEDPEEAFTSAADQIRNLIESGG